MPTVYHGMREFMASRKSKRKENLIALFIALTMVSSVFGVIFYGFSDPGETQKYNGFTFKRAGNEYITKINNKELHFYYLPDQVIQINLTKTLQDILNNSMVIQLTFNPEDKNVELFELVRYEFSELMVEEIVDTIFLPGITTQSDTYNLPIITCKNATMFQPVFYFKSGNSTKIEQIGTCTIFQAAHATDILELRDRIIYQLTGIIK